MKWTRILDTKLGEAAWEILGASQCDYHNGWHVVKMYDYLDKTNEPYDEALDWAVLFHDIVYDNQPDKEFRSADLFLKMRHEHDGCNLDFDDKVKVVSMIYSTTTHEVTAPFHSAIVRADLHALTNPVDVVYNYMSIMDESIWLYKIDEQTFAENNIRFMGGNPLGGDDRGLYGRVEKNMETDPDHREFYKDVKRGIVSTINLSRIIKGDL